MWGVSSQNEDLCFLNSKLSPLTICKYWMLGKVLKDRYSVGMIWLGHVQAKLVV